MEAKSRVYNILIIDDSDEDRALYRRLIARGRDDEFDFSETASGEEGLRLYYSERPDCVLLDYSLPDLSGLEFLSRLDQGGEDETTPIIMLTGQGTERIAVQALKMGAQDYIVKDHAGETVKFSVHALIEKAMLSREIKEQRRDMADATRALAENEERYRLWGARTHREFAARYRMLVENDLISAIIILDRENRISLWNSTAEALYGYRADEIIGRHIARLYTPAELRTGRVQQQFDLATSSDSSIHEGWRLCKDGSQFLAIVSVTALRNESGDPCGFVEVTHSISERATAGT